MSDVSFLSQVLIFLLAAVAVAPVFQWLRLSPVLGYLVAGIAIGPQRLALITESETTHGLAQLGVIFLLFSIGLELSIDRLRVIRTYVLGLGGAQVLVTGGVIGLIAALSGASLESSIVIGGALALSSTAVVLQLLSERGELATRVGRMALAILLLQDLAVVPLLALVPSLADEAGSLAGTVTWTLLKAAAAVIVIFGLGRLVLRPIFRTAAMGRRPELLAAVTLLVLLGMSWATGRLGLSLAIGAFMAGLLLSETEYRHQVEVDIAPFRGLLLGLFFMTVGMGLDLGLAAEQAGLVALLVVGLVVLKAAIVIALALIVRTGLGPSLHVGMLLAQGGEFAFIMFALAIAAGILDPGLGGLLALTVALTMALTPLLAVAGRRVDTVLRMRGADDVERIEDETRDLRDHVIIAGFGRVGQSVAKTLQAADIPFIGLETDPIRVSRCRGAGLPVYFGDASRPGVLRAVGADRARAAVVTMDDPGAAERAVELLHRHHRALHIFVRARDNVHRDRLEAAGASGIVHETFEMSLQLGGSVLRRLGAADDVIDEIIRAHRAADYARLSTTLASGAAKAEPATEEDAPDAASNGEE